MKQYEYHEYANIIPKMSDEEFEELKQDIKQNDLLDDIILFEDEILDGRHRYEACKELGKELTFKDFEELDVDLSPLEYVLSENLKRRHLTSSQKATIAVDAEDVMKKLEKEAKERKQSTLKEGDKNPDTQKVAERERGEAREKLAETFGTNRQYISDAKNIKKEDPESHEKIKRGEKTISEYKREKKKAEREEKMKESENKAIKQSDFKPVISHGNYDNLLSKFDDNTFDLLLTDPPYSTDIKDIDEFAEKWINATLSKLKDSAQAYIFTGAYPNELETYLNVLNHHQRFSLTNILVWTYRNTLGPQPNDQYKLNWQAIFYLRGSEAPDLDCPKMKEQFSVQDINAPDGRQANRFHKWQKPNKIANRFIRHSTKEKDKILDPFAGTGTFLIEGAKLNRETIGCDKDNEILEIAKERGCKVK